MLHLMHHFNLFVFLSVLSLLSYLYAVHARVHEANLEDGAVRDHLTGLFNRRYVSRLFVKTFSDRKRRPVSPGILLVDIDHFKRVNDTYGHACGDTVIVHVARTLVREAPGTTAVARWGGEEFLLLFDDIDGDTLREAAESIRHGVERTPAVCGETSIPVTVTIGGSLFRGDESVEALLQRADTALYQGKRNGRNRTVIL